MKPGNRSRTCAARCQFPRRQALRRKMRRDADMFPQARRTAGFFVRCKSTGGNIHADIVFTSESVTEGHPDKICDQISDAVLDAILAQGPRRARAPANAAATTGMVLVMGEITTSAYVPIDQIARNKIVEIGYDRAKYGFDGQSCAVLVSRGRAVAGHRAWA